MSDLKFKNGKFRILQISDAQDLHWVRKSMVRMIESACDKVNPDLVVFTGDNILGNHLLDRRFGKGKRNLSRDEEYEILKTALGHILDIPEKRNIPFALIFGNHDDRNSFTKDEQADIFRSYSCNRGFENTEKLCGTYELPIKSSDEKNTAMVLWMIDTAWYDREQDKCFCEITKDTVDWFKKQSEDNKRNNSGKPYDSLMFVHIPLPKAQEFVKECSKEEAEAEFDGKYYCLDRTKATGSIGEIEGPVDTDSGLYEAVLKDGGVKSIIAGHDHNNMFEGILDNIRFIATPGASFRSYGNDNRGVRVFDIDENDVGNFDTYVLHYPELVGDDMISKFRYFWDADDKEQEKINILKNVGISLAATAATQIIMKAVKKHKK